MKLRTLLLDFFPLELFKEGRKDAILIGLITVMFLLNVVSPASMRIDENKHITEPVVEVTKNPRLCWQFENFVTQTECLQCTSREKSEILACKETGNKQLVQCQDSKTKTYVSCPFVGSVEKKRFWTFEAVSFAFAVLSNLVVWWRRRSLNYIHYQRVKRQMSDASV